MRFRFNSTFPNLNIQVMTLNNPEQTLDPELDSDAQVHATQNGETGADETAQKLAETEEKLAYLAAELENYKRQTNRRMEEDRARTSRRVFDQILPALDNFALAMKYAGNAQDVNQLKTGLEFVAQQMQTSLEGAGLEAIPAAGQMFDPQRHEAIEEVESDQPSGTVVEELQRGYLYQGEVLRPARVKVAR